MDMTKDIIDFTQKLDQSVSKNSLTSSISNEMTEKEETCLGSASTPISYSTSSGKSPIFTSANDLVPTTIDHEASAPTTTSSPSSKQPLTAKMVKEVTVLSHNLERGNLTPPPRPLTSSEVVGLSATLDDPDMRVGITLNKSRSLPASPNRITPSTDLPQMTAALIDFKQLSKHSLNYSPTKIDNCALESLIPSNHLTSNFDSKDLSTETPGNQQFCLRWNNYQTNLTNVFDELLQNESFVDVTLACEGQSIKAHKMVLSACSPYFQALFYENPCQHPIIIMRDVRWEELKALMEFMYKGEINVSQDQINPLLKVAEMLKIRGLAEVSSGQHDQHGIAAHPMIAKQHMTVFGEDYDDMDNDDEEGDGDDDYHKPKRPRVRQTPVDKSPLALDLDLNGKCSRKRSHEGLLLKDNMNDFPGTRNRSPSPPLLQHHSQNETDANKAGMSLPTSMTASTIVSNPFASPNSTVSTNNINAPSISTSTSSLSSGSTTSSSSVSSTYGGSVYRSSINRSPPLQLTHSNGISLPAVSPALHDSHQLPAHLHSAPAAAAAIVGTHHPHHRHHATTAAQQHAAQHQMHGTAQSHTVMATALGASLAAAAAGVASNSTGGGGGSAVPNPPAIVHHDDLEIKPEIAEMIREEERAKMIESGHPWMGGASTSSVADSYQYQLQSMWQKCWNTNQHNLVQQLRFRERGPLKSWRPEAMAEAIFSVLKEGLSLSQAARKYDIPYPTFVLYANRVHNMLGPSLDGGADPRPKARGRPQRILLGMWPEELIRSVIKAVVFRDYREIKDDMTPSYANGQGHGSHFATSSNAGIANGYHNATKVAAQNAALAAASDSSNPLSAMTENLRRQIMSQQQQSPLPQNINMYKSPAYLQRSEIEDQVSAAGGVAAKQQNDRRSTDNLSDLNALGLIGIPGLNIMPTQTQRNQMQQNVTAYSREREREKDRERERDRERDRERERERERELKESIQLRQFNNPVRNSTGLQKQPIIGSNTSGPPPSYSHFKGKEHSNYVYNKRFLESLPPGIDFEAIANGLLQKSVNKSPRFEDFFPTQEISDLFPNADASGSGSGSYPNVRDSSQMKIKLEQQAADMPHED